MMMMETANLEEDKSQMMIIKGKRTKRPRQSSPIVLTTTASSSSSPGGGGDDVEDHHHHQSGMMSTPIKVSDQDDETTSSPATSAELTEMSTTEEEDMANCLILLAQSDQTQIRKVQEQQLLLQQQPIKAVAAADTAPGLYVYECKTCNRCFSSFQALGGHRASHKKPKVISIVTNTKQAQPKKALSFMEDQDEYDRRFNNNTTSTTLSLQVSNRVFGNSKGTKVHECSVCGAEFASGQALGGHMRRHRTFINTTTTAPVAPTMSSPQSHQASNKRPRSVLELDLNLPAPEEERLDITKLPFSSSKKHYNTHCNFRQWKLSVKAVFSLEMLFPTKYFSSEGVVNTPVGNTIFPTNRRKFFLISDENTRRKLVGTYYLFCPKISRR